MRTPDWKLRGGGQVDGSRATRKLTVTIGLADEGNKGFASITEIYSGTERH
jgi:hypothetical protein